MPKRSRPRDRDRKGPPHATGLHLGLGRGVGPLGATLESASRETCQHVTTERANGVFRNRQVGPAQVGFPVWCAPDCHLIKDWHGDAACMYDLQGG